MSMTLDVLVVESAPGAADETDRALTDAGHRTHRCYLSGDRGFPCQGVIDPARCPLDNGVDVAVLVRPRVTPRPTELETGVSCALRAGIPLVEQGPEPLDPFAPWVAARVPATTSTSTSTSSAGIVEACTEAAETVFDQLVDRIRRRTLRTMATAAGRPGPLGCAVRRHGSGLRVELSGPPVGPAVEHALAVRVHDAVTAEALPHTTLDVAYRATA